MEATLVVPDNGLAPKPRPRIELKMKHLTLERTLARGALEVGVRVDQFSDDVKLVAKAGKLTLSAIKGIDVGTEEFERVRMALRPAARRALAKRDAVNITVVGAPRFGESEVLSRRLG